MVKGLLLLALLSSISLVIQLLPVISVPITGIDNKYSLYFAKHNNIAFGVFGLCDYVRDQCTPPAIGYPIGVKFLPEADSGGVELPSDARYSISKLLVVHVVAFALSCLSVGGSFIFILVIWLKQKWQEFTIAREEKKKNEEIQPDDNESSNKTVNDTKRKRGVNLIPFLNIQLVISILSCLFTLLGLLSDILLFTPSMSFLGWIQLIPVICLAIMVSMACFMRRSIFSRRYLDEEYFYPNDDMKERHNLHVMDSIDTSSDDGFFVYTNGFYSNYGDNEHRDQSHQNANIWRRHTPYNEDEVSINSREFNGILNRERIQLQDLNRVSRSTSRSASRSASSSVDHLPP